jgi:hypothetical protein
MHQQHASSAECRSHFSHAMLLCILPGCSSLMHATHALQAQPPSLAAVRPQQQQQQQQTAPPQHPSSSSSSSSPTAPQTPSSLAHSLLSSPTWDWAQHPAPAAATPSHHTHPPLLLQLRRQQQCHCLATQQQQQHLQVDLPTGLQSIQCAAAAACSPSSLL